VDSENVVSFQREKKEYDYDDNRSKNDVGSGDTEYPRQ
jgi:hypothetical protein